MTNQGEEGGKEKTKDRVVREQATQDNTDIPSNKREQGGSASPIEGAMKDSNSLIKEAYRYSEMTPIEVGTEDPNLIDIMEREGIGLPNILEQWKR